jgi:hypothetical protein
MKECDPNTDRNLQLCSAVDRIQLATDSCMKKKARVHAHIHKISMILDTDTGMENVAL